LGVIDYFSGGKGAVLGSEVHLDAAMSWLCRAQDVGDDRGLARMYHARKGWGASYPETTGYAIPTFIHYGKHYGLADFVKRAHEMARWESQIQMSSGAVQGGVVSDPPTPAMFNTGQVLFGWAAAHEDSPSDTYRDSALAAGAYMCAQQDDDGAWRQNLSDFCDAPSEQFTYNVRSAWALMRAARVFGVDQFKSCAQANARFVLTRAHDNGWFEDNCLSTPTQPLLHTIAYTFQGLLELALLADLQEGIDVVVRGNTALLNEFEKSGQLHGRYDARWAPVVSWRCLTGEAQTAIVWFRLAEITGQDKWSEAARGVLRQLKATQALEGDDGVKGGIKGSQPITAPYGRLEYLNWAAKFFADALMLDLSIEGASASG
jgi:hypothetical protein